MDVMDDVCELLNKRQRTAKVPGLKRLGNKLGIEKEILDDLLPTQEETVSPTEALIHHLEGRQPWLTLQDFIWALHAIMRNDAIAVLDVYMSGKAVGISVVGSLKACFHYRINISFIRKGRDILIISACSLSSYVF